MSRAEDKRRRMERGEEIRGAVQSAENKIISVK
jgi:hypothetical protein